MIFPVVGPVFAFGPDGGPWRWPDLWPDTAPQITTRSTCRSTGSPPQLHAQPAHGLGRRDLHPLPEGPAPAALGGTFWLIATLAATLGFG
nr:hypothetical protein [Streptomyces clavuligerus]